MRPSTGTPDQKESYQIGYGSHLEAVWPAEAECPGFRAAATAFMAQAHEVSCKLLRCFAAGLGFAQDAFASEHDPRRDDVLTALRILHYPECTGTTWPANYW